MKIADDGPHVAVADVVDDAPNGQVVIGLFGVRGRRAAGVVVHDPQDAQRGHRTGRDVFVEVLQPQIDAELVGNAQIELREVLDEVVRHGRDRGLCLDRVLIVTASVSCPASKLLRVGVELAPARLAGRPIRLQERIVLDVFAVDLHRQTGGRRFREQEALVLIGECIAGVPAWIAADPVRRLDVVGVGRHALGDPLVTVSRLAARVVEIVEEREALHQRVRVRRVLAAEHCQRGVAIAGGHVAQNLIIGAVFTDDQEHVLDQRRIADLRRDCDRLGVRAATGGRLDVLRQIPVVVLENLRSSSPPRSRLFGTGTMLTVPLSWWVL